MPITLSSAEFDSIRELAGPKIDRTDLNDSTLNRDAFAGEACDFVFNKIKQLLDSDEPDDAAFLSTLTTEQRRYYRRAIIYRTAANVAGSAPRLNRQAAASIEEGRQLQDLSELKSDLFARANAQIQNIVDAATTRTRTKFKLFAVTRC